jgi:hypothetical protein
MESTEHLDNIVIDGQQHNRWSIRNLYRIQITCAVSSGMEHTLTIACFQEVWFRKLDQNKHSLITRHKRLITREALAHPKPRGQLALEHKRKLGTSWSSLHNVEPLTLVFKPFGGYSCSVAKLHDLKDPCSLHEELGKLEMWLPTWILLQAAWWSWGCGRGTRWELMDWRAQYLSNSSIFWQRTINSIHQ